MSNIHIDLTNIHTVMNKSFYPLLWNEMRYLLFKGGAGSGKSWFIAQKLLIRILMDLNNKVRHRVLALRKYSTDAEDSVFKLFTSTIAEWGLDSLVEINKTKKRITFIDGSEIICKGLDDPNKLKSIYDITSVWMEEATEFTTNDFDEVDRRLRGNLGTYKQIILSFNPISKLSWVYQLFVKNENPYAFIHHSTFEDNEYLDDEYRNILQRYKNTKNNYQYEVYYLGNWGSLEGLIYTNWIYIDEFPICDEIVYGCDFGFNDPNAVVKVGTRKDGFYVEELLYNSDMTNSDLIDWFKAKLPSGECIVYCDSANPDRITEIQRAGIRARPSKKGQGSVQTGIDYVKSKDLYVKGNNLLNEIQDYVYKKDRFGRSMERPVDGNDHLLDAMRYAVFSHFTKKMDLTFITSSGD